nr:MAG TPA: hypothetical protein [Caudoviricetes sp.]
MNEEEIIKNIKEMIQWSDHNTYKIALRGILDLYEQEKARNKDLEQIEKEHKEENGRLRKELDKKENTINLMAEQLTTPVHNKKWVIEYFTNKVEEDIKE